MPQERRKMPIRNCVLFKLKTKTKIVRSYTKNKNGNNDTNLF